MEKFSEQNQHRVIVCAILLQDENPISRRSIQNISRIYICTAVLYRCIVFVFYRCFVLLYCSIVFLEFAQITEQNNLKKYCLKIQKRRDRFLFSLFNKALGSVGLYENCGVVKANYGHCKPADWTLLFTMLGCCCT